MLSMFNGVGKLLNKIKISKTSESAKSQLTYKGICGMTGIIHLEFMEGGNIHDRHPD